MEKITKNNRKKLVLYIAIIGLFISAFIFFGVKYAPSVTALLAKPQKFREFLLSYGYASAFVFIFFQILQVVVAFIPGEAVQIAGGYVYGTALGTLYSITGILLGTIIVFYTVKLIGYPLVRMFVSEQNLEKFHFLLNSQKSEIAIFILFLIPGLPKDVLTYMAGLTPVDSRKFLLIVTTARLPGLIGSALIGSNIQNKNYTALVILSAIALLLFAAGVLGRDKLIALASNILHRDR
ncbi:MAG: TVP38/TMEM64 family protein [Clostridiales bacterium]|nr:TVP38/TMEM64 family protein [Eubacteriales bacterium]MDH7565672.1 TVP38/TMEM64 family protein [Clostridiales bacterium]